MGSHPVGSLRGPSQAVLRRSLRSAAGQRKLSLQEQNARATPRPQNRQGTSCFLMEPKKVPIPQSDLRLQSRADSDSGKAEGLVVGDEDFCRIGGCVVMPHRRNVSMADWRMFVQFR